MKNPDHISECLATIFLVKILKFFEADLGLKIRIRDKHPGFTTVIRNNFNSADAILGSVADPDPGSF
jgi:hypothetical protein